MDTKKISENLLKLVEEQSSSDMKLDENAIRRFIRFCEDRGYKTGYRGDYYSRDYYVTINGYKVFLNKYDNKLDDKGFTSFVIAPSKAAFSRKAQRIYTKDFYSERDFFEAVLTKMENLASEQIKNKFGKSKTITGNRKELLDLLNKLDIDDKVQLTLTYYSKE